MDFTIRQKRCIEMMTSSALTKYFSTHSSVGGNGHFVIMLYLYIVHMNCLNMWLKYQLYWAKCC